MLTVTGLIFVQSEPTIKPAITGSYFKFEAVSIDMRKQAKHSYKVDLWVPPGATDLARKALVPKTSILLNHANWSATPFKEGIVNRLQASWSGITIL